MRNLINFITTRLGKDNYSLDDSIGAYSVFIIFLQKFVLLVRGAIFKVFFKRSGFLFLGKGTRISHKHMITLGSVVTIENNVVIDGLTKGGIVIGNNTTLKSGVIVDSGLLSNIGESLFIGNNVGISQGCFLQVSADLNISDNVIIGPYVKIYTENHNHANLKEFINTQGVSRKSVYIDKGVWIGSGSIILPGITLGKGCIVGAGSVVTKDVNPYTIVAGVPAKCIKKRLSGVK